MPLERRRSKDIQLENTSPQAVQPFNPIREKKREQTLISNENKVKYRVNNYDRKITEAGEYARSKLTPKEIEEFTSYNSKKRRNQRNEYSNEEYTYEEKNANSKYARLCNEYRSECQKNQGKETKQEKRRGESFLEDLPESDKKAVLELASFCDEYGLKKTEKMFDLGYQIYLESSTKSHIDRKEGGNNYRDYIDELSKYNKKSLDLYGRWKRRYELKDKAKEEFKRIYKLCCDYRSLLENAESSKKRKATSDKQSDNDVQKRLKLDKSGNSGMPLEQSDPSHEKRGEGGKSGDDKMGEHLEAEEQEIAARELELEDKKERSRLKLISEFYKKREEGGKSVGDKMGGHSEVEEQGKRGEDIPWSPSDHPEGWQTKKPRTNRKARQPFGELQRDGSKQAQAEREQRPAVEAQGPQATEQEPENPSPQPFDSSNEKKKDQNLKQNENGAMYRVDSYNRTKNKNGEYARSKLTKEELIALASYNRKNVSNSRNPDKKEEFTEKEKEARKKYRYYLDEYKQHISEIQENQEKETKQEKSRGESFLESLSEVDGQAFCEIIDFFDKFGFKETKEMLIVGHEIDLERKRIRRKDNKEADDNASNYIKNLPEYQRESYKLYKRWQGRHSTDAKAEKEFKKIYKLCCDYRKLLDNAESSQKRKAASDKQSDNDVQKRLKLDQSGNSGEPLEQSDPSHEKTEEGGKNGGGKTGGHSEAEEQGKRGEADHSDLQVVPPGRAQASSHSEYLDLEVGHGQQGVPVDQAPALSHPGHPNSQHESLSSESPFDFLGDIHLPDDLNGIDFSNSLSERDHLDLESISTPVASHLDHPNPHDEALPLERDLLDQQSVSAPVASHLDHPNPQDGSLPSERDLESLSQRDNERDGVDHHEARPEQEVPSLSHEETLILKDSFIYPIRKDGRIQECRIGAGNPESSDRAFLYLKSENTYFLYFTDDPDNDVYALNPQRYLLISPKTVGCELLSKRDAVAYLQGKNQAIEQQRGSLLLAPSGAERRVDVSSVSSNSQTIPDVQAGERSLLDPGDALSSRLPHQEGHHFSAQFSAEEAVRGSESDAGQIFSQGEHAGSQSRLPQDGRRAFQAFNGFLLEEDDASASHDPVQLDNYMNALIAGGDTVGDENRLFSHNDGPPSSAEDHLPDIWNQWADLLRGGADVDLSSFEYPSDVNNPYTDRSGLVSPSLDDNSGFDGLRHISVSGEGNNCGPRALLTVAHYDPGTGSWEEGWNEVRVEQIVTEVRKDLRSIPWNGPHGETTMAGRDGCDDFLEMGDEPGMQVVTYLQSKGLLDASRDVIVTDRHAGGQLSSHMIVGDANHPRPNPYRIYLDYEGHHFSAQFPAEVAVGGSESNVDRILSQGEHVLMQGEGRVSQSFTDLLQGEDNASANPDFLNPYLISPNNEGLHSSPVSNLLENGNQLQDLLTNEADPNLPSFELMFTEADEPYNHNPELVNSLLYDNDGSDNLHSSSMPETHLRDAETTDSSLSKKHKDVIQKFIEVRLQLGPREYFPKDFREELLREVLSNDDTTKKARQFIREMFTNKEKQKKLVRALNKIKERVKDSSLPETHQRSYEVRGSDLSEEQEATINRFVQVKLQLGKNQLFPKDLREELLREIITNDNTYKKALQSIRKAVTNKGDQEKLVHFLSHIKYTVKDSSLPEIRLSEEQKVTINRFIEVRRQLGPRESFPKDLRKELLREIIANDGIYEKARQFIGEVVPDKGDRDKLLKSLSHIKTTGKDSSLPETRLSKKQKATINKFIKVKLQLGEGQPLPKDLREELLREVLSNDTTYKKALQFIRKKEVINEEKTKKLLKFINSIKKVGK